jgi:hypothetical protein
MNIFKPGEEINLKVLYVGPMQMNGDTMIDVHVVHVHMHQKRNTLGMHLHVDSSVLSKIVENKSDK